RRVQPQRRRERLGSALTLVAGGQQTLFGGGRLSAGAFGVEGASQSLSLPGLGEPRQSLGFLNELLLDSNRRVGFDQRQVSYGNIEQRSLYLGELVAFRGLDETMGREVPIDRLADVRRDPDGS